VQVLEFGLDILAMIIGLFYIYTVEWPSFWVNAAFIVVVIEFTLDT
jgi:hypothetical protein